MRIKGSGGHGLCAGLLWLSLAVSGCVYGATFTVNSSNDIDDDACNAAHCSLREAIKAANNAAGSDDIRFNIPGSGPHSIRPLTSLPAITDPVTIDGYTQPGAARATAMSHAVVMIEIDGAVVAGNGLHVKAGGTRIFGLAISLFPTGILLQDQGGDVIQGNFIGTDPSGTLDDGNSTGIFLDAPPGGPFGGHLIGGDTPAARNIISGNNTYGIRIHKAVANRIIGNYIGTDVTGTVELGNGWDGIFIHTADNIIGGAAAGEGNVISANGFNGIKVFGVAEQNIIRGNLIGTDVSGTVAMPNDDSAVFIDRASGNQVGGAQAGEGNVLAASQDHGVLISGPNADSNTVQGNFIGTDRSATLDLGNSADGVQIRNDADNNTIGGQEPGAGNVIAHNGDNGVRVSGDSTNNGILSNTIHSNSDLGIDLAPGGSGVTPNDAGDEDIGPNSLQNFPVLTAVSTDNDSTAIEGSLNSAANTTFVVEFFSNDPADFSGFGEGENLIGRANVMTGPSGYVSFNVNLPLLVSPSDFVTATATSPDHNTSEFSKAVQPAAAPVLPNATDDLATVSENTSISIDVLANDLADTGANKTIMTFEQGEYGSVVEDANGNLLYTPDANFNGAENFFYTMGDGLGGSDTALVSILVSSSPQAGGVMIVKDGALDPGADGIATPGDVINYTFEVSNSGEVTLNNILLSDPLVPAIACPGGHPIATLAPAATETCTGSYAITQADFNVGAVNNTVTANAECNAPNCPVNDSDEHNEMLEPVADLAILKDNGLVSVQPGQPIDYIIEAWNLGPSNVVGAQVEDLIPEELENCSWQCAPQNEGASCTIGPVAGDIIDYIDLPAGSSVAYLLECTVTEAEFDGLSNSASVTSPAGTLDPVPGNNESTDFDTGPGLFNSSFE